MGDLYRDLILIASQADLKLRLGNLAYLVPIFFKRKKYYKMLKKYEILFLIMTCGDSDKHFLLL